MENQASIYVSESLNSFIEYLNEKYDSDRVVDDAKIKDEILFEQFLKSRSRRGINKLILNTFYNGKNVRRDLAGGLELKKNELQFRNHIADFLRNVREESKNGYRDLSPKEQEAILNLRLEELGNLFGNYDIFFSRRKLKYRTGNKREYKKETLPLRKEATILVIRCYKPYGLFCEREQGDESIDLKEESPVLEEFREKAREYYQEHREKAREYYQEHKEKIRERQRKYHQEHREKIRKYHREYTQEHRGKIRERQRKYYQEHKEQKREYYQEHKEKIREHRRKYYQEHRELANQLELPSFL